MMQLFGRRIDDDYITRSLESICLSMESVHNSSFWGGLLVDAKYTGKHVCPRNADQVIWVSFLRAQKGEVHPFWEVHSKQTPMLVYHVVILLVDDSISHHFEAMVATIVAIYR